MLLPKGHTEELGIRPPETWDGVKIAISVLNKKQMEFGILPRIMSGRRRDASHFTGAYRDFLYQNGGEFYNSSDNLSWIRMSNKCFRGFTGTIQSISSKGVDL